MAKITKRGRNPGAVDSWLDNLGLYRKNVAYDETCLFRAVSEQLFDCQVYHERVRRECITYAKDNFEEFSYLVDSDDDWQEHLSLLKKHMVICGNIEINIISKKYSHDVVIFDAIHQEVYQVTNNNFPVVLRLCLMDEDHYDVVYNREHIVTAAIVYKVLYEQVFNITNVDEIVKAMLYEKNSIVTQAELIAEKKKNLEVNNNETALLTVKEETVGDQLPQTNNNIAPFPFKVAKALDPTIYRNIEYDSWGEVRREMRLGDWYYGDDKLILGTRCVLNDKMTNEMYDCYIQEIIKDQNMCVVYLTKLAEKRTVNYTDLSPENDAKPWPLPYRFSKNLVISGSPQVLPIENKARTSKKRNKEKRRTKSCSETSAPVPSETVENVSAYVGVPLQMHHPSGSNYHENEVSTDCQTEQPVSEQVITPDIQSSSARYQWDQTHWHPLLPPTPDPMVWPQTPTTPQNMFNFNVKPMIASAPVTPDVVPYHDSNFPFYFNYQVDPYQPYSYWHHQPFEMQPPHLRTEIEKPSEEPHKSQPTEAENNTNITNYTENENIYEQTTIASPARPTVCTNLTPQNTPVEMYSPMMPLPPGTPVIYGPGPPELTEVVVTSPPIIYSPPLDMQYLSPQFIYPPTPPAAWYPAGVNAHGFIFPRQQ